MVGCDQLCRVVKHGLFPVAGRARNPKKLQLLDNRARPPVRDDERQGIIMLRTNMNEMNV